MRTFTNPIYDYSGIVEAIKTPYSTFIQKITRQKKAKLGQQMFGWIYHWAREKAGKTISLRFHNAWLAMVAECNPLAITLQKRAYSCFAKIGWMGMAGFGDVLRECKDEPYFYSDIMKYRYFAYAIFGSIYDRNELEIGYLDRIDRTHRSRTSFLNMPYRTPLHVFNGAVEYIDRHGDFPRILRSIEDWAFISTTNTKVYNRHLPLDRFAVLLERSGQDEMVNAHRLVAATMGTKRRRRSFRNALETFDYILDAPLERPEARITSVARDSIKWHAGYINRLIPEFPFGQNGFLAQEPKIEYGQFPEPPFTLGENPYVRYLGDHASLKEESAVMGNCVESYAKSCSLGRSFIFSYNKPGIGRATVEIDSFGQIVQCQGFGNKRDEASQFAYRAIGRIIRNGKSKRTYQQAEAEAI